MVKLFYGFQEIARLFYFNLRITSNTNFKLENSIKKQF